MSTLQTQIPRRLQEIDSATFQLLVNQYLWLKEDIVSISPNGSHAFKLKTTTGQPDAHFWLRDGRMLWAECTTTAEKKATVSKFKGDIDGCVEERDKLGITPEKIRELKLCYTVDLSTEQETGLKTYGQERGFEITFLGLGTLAADLQNRYPGLAELFLSVSIGTGQLFLIDQFVKYKANYSGGIATPLDNPFVGRESEVDQLKDKVEQFPVVCVTGASGVGKSRLVLHTLRKLSEEQKVPVFVLEHNGQNVYHDLHQWFTNLESSYLLIEDANRQLGNLKQVLGFMKKNLRKRFRVVLTVRNYAKEAVELELLETNTDWMTVSLVSDEEIRKIVANAPFEITSNTQQWDISRLVNGNIRFAMMAARLLRDKEVEKLPASFLELFDLYFNTYIRDFANLLTADYIKTLGLLSLFKAFDLSTNKTKGFNLLLADFDVAPANFQACIEELRRRELVTRKYDMVILSEQVFSTYFFYLAFIKHKFLSFQQAMTYEVDRKYHNKMSEHVNEIGQRFGTQVVLDAVKGDLLAREKELETDTDWDQYLSTYWRFRKKQLLQRIQLRIKKMPFVSNTHYEVAIDNRTINHYTHSKELRLLENLFLAEQAIFERAVHLSFQYCLRKPSTFLGLIKSCKEGILLRGDGLLEDAERQRYLFRFLFDGMAEGEPIYKAVFLSTAGFYLSHGSSVQEYLYAAKGNPGETSAAPDQQLRVKIWQQLHHLYPSQVNAVNNMLQLLANGRYSRITKDLLALDIRWIKMIINDYFNPGNIGDAAMAQELMNALEQYKPEAEWGQIEIDAIKRRFTTPTLRTLKDLGWQFWDHHRERSMGPDDQRAQHTAFLRETYLFEELEKATVFTRQLEEMVRAGLLVGFELDRGLKDILEVNLKKDLKIGRYLLGEWLRLDLPLDRNMVTFIGSDEKFIRLYLNALDTLPEAYQKNQFWFFLQTISPEFLDGAIRKRMVAIISDLPKRATVNFHFLQREAADEHQLFSWLSLIRKQTEAGKQFCFFGEEDMVDFLIMHDLKSAKAIYLHQVVTDDFFDHRLEILRKILMRSPGFVVDYVRAEFIESNSGKHINRRRQLGLVWDVSKTLLYFSVCADLLEGAIHVHLYENGALKELLNGIKEEFKATIKPVVFDYLVANLDSKNKRRMILDGIRTQLTDFYAEAVYLYLDHDNSVETFRSISWTPSGGMFAANTNVSRWRKKNWERVQELILGYDGSSDISAILDVIQKEIDWYDGEAHDEDKRIFAYYN